MAVLLEGNALPKTDVHTKSPEASENPLQLGAVTISILYKIMPRTAQLPTGQGGSLEILLPQPCSPHCADPGQTHLGGHSNKDRLAVLLGFVPAQPVLPQMVQEHNKAPQVLQLIQQI